MGKAQPKKLQGAPITMAVVELRFESTLDFSLRTTHLLQLLLQAGVTHIKPANPDFDLPSAILRENAEFQYASVFACNYKDVRVTFGPRVIDVFAPIPYEGWDTWFPLVEELMRRIMSDEVGFSPIRLGVRFVNSLPTSWVKGTTLDISVNGSPVRSDQMNVRYVRNNDDCEIAVVVKGSVSGDDVRTIVDIDVICKWEIGEADPQEVVDSARRAHEIEKEAFYSLVSDDLVKNFGPEYD